MKELVAMMDEIKVAVEKNVDLEQKKKELLDNMRKVIRDNYKNVMFEELAIYYQLARDLSVKFACSTMYEDPEVSMRLKFYRNDTEVWLKCTAKSGSWYYFGFKGDSCELSYMERAEETPLKLLSEYLDTEEHALNLLKRIRKGYLVILTGILEHINKENDELYKAVQDLTERLNTSSVMTEDEDGTVEIHLNGKTFRGKVTEE